MRYNYVTEAGKTLTFISDQHIRTSYWAKPIPIRDFDWDAVFDDDYEPGQPIGYGSSEQEAIDDLLDQYPNDEQLRYETETKINK